MNLQCSQLALPLHRQRVLSWHSQQTLPQRVCTPCKCVQQQARTQRILSGTCYEDVVDQLARSALQAAGKASAAQKYIIGIAGAPGSGKSTLATMVRDRINELQPNDQGTTAQVVPMDGFHYYKAELDCMPDPKEAYRRRGAHWTFNAAKFVKCVRQLKEQGHGRVPSFDHAEGDPREGGLLVSQGTRVLLVEGNYVLLPLEPWCQLRLLFDEAWFVDVDIDVAMERVFERQTSIGLAPEVSRERIRSNDRPNGEEINATRRHADVVIPSSIPLRSSGR